MIALRHRFAAELIGTFGIVFAPVALSASAHFPGGDTGLGAAAWVSGLAVLAMIYALGPVSAAHFNPAVTVGFAVAGRFPWRHAGSYILAQVLGAILAAGLVRLLFPFANAGVHLPAADLGVPRALGIEATLTFLLMLVILAVATDKRVSGAVPALAIGFTVVFCVYIGGPATGGSMNPARSLGPALFAGGPALAAWWQYLVGPLLGATLAARVFETFLRPDAARPHTQNAPADLPHRLPAEIATTS